MGRYLHTFLRYVCSLTDRLPRLFHTALVRVWMRSSALSCHLEKLIIWHDVTGITILQTHKSKEGEFRFISKPPHRLQNQWVQSTTRLVGRIILGSMFSEAVYTPLNVLWAALYSAQCSLSRFIPGSIFSEGVYTRLKCSLRRFILGSMFSDPVLSEVDRADKT